MTAASPTLRPGAAAVASALRVFQRNFLVYRRTWRGSVFYSFLQPFLFLTAMGLGLGALLNPRDTSLLGDIPYITFLAPGLLAAACMQTCVFECSFPILGKIRWRRNYEAMLATPLDVTALTIGELGWMAFRATSVAAAFLVIITAFGLAWSPLAVLALPAAVLTGLGFAAWMIAFTATQKNDSGFAWIFRFVMNPLFLFSGVFFPVDRLPDVIEWLALATPLHHGVQLTRGTTLGTIGPGPAVLHSVYLIVFFVVGAVLARWSLHRRLVK